MLTMTRSRGRVTAMTRARSILIGIAAFATTVLTILAQAAAAGAAPFA